MIEKDATVKKFGGKFQPALEMLASAEYHFSEVVPY